MSEVLEKRRRYSMLQGVSVRGTKKYIKAASALAPYRCSFSYFFYSCICCFWLPITVLLFFFYFSNFSVENLKLFSCFFSTLPFFSFDWEGGIRIQCCTV